MVNIEIKFIIFFAAKDGEALYSQQKQEQELTMAQIMNSFIAKFRLKLKKVGKTIRPFSYDLNQIPYDYTVEERNRFKGLDLIDRVPDELWNEVHDIEQETGIKTIPMEKKCKKQNGCLGRPYKELWKEEKRKAKEKKKDISIWMQSSREEQEEIRKHSSVINARNRGKQQNGKD